MDSTIAGVGWDESVLRAMWDPVGGMVAVESAYVVLGRRRQADGMDPGVLKKKKKKKKKKEEVREP